jgi:predicted metal-binding membrane protein
MGLLALGAVHMLILGLDALPFGAGWASGGLWSLEHWLPIDRQSPALVKSGLAFWATMGSMALPMMFLASLLLWLDRRDIPIPRAIPVLLLIWALMLVAIMPPSGFPLVAAAAAALALGRPGGGWA